MSSNFVCNHYSRKQNWTRTLRSSNVYHSYSMITDRIGLHSVLLPLLKFRDITISKSKQARKVSYLLVRSDSRRGQRGPISFGPPGELFQSCTHLPSGTPVSRVPVAGVREHSTTYLHNMKGKMSLDTLIYFVSPTTEGK